MVHPYNDRRYGGPLSATQGFVDSYQRGLMIARQMQRDRQLADYRQSVLDLQEQGSKTSQARLDETRRHNQAMETIAFGRQKPSYPYNEERFAKALGALGTGSTFSDNNQYGLRLENEFTSPEEAIAWFDQEVGRGWREHKKEEVYEAMKQGFPDWTPDQDPGPQAMFDEPTEAPTEDVSSSGDFTMPGNFNEFLMRKGSMQEAGIGNVLTYVSQNPDKAVETYTPILKQNGADESDIAELREIFSNGTDEQKQMAIKRIYDMQGK